MDRCKAADVLCSFIRQMLEVYSSCHKEIFQIVERHRVSRKQSWTRVRQAEAMLREIASLFDSVEAVVDGLDEMERSEREGLMSALSRLPIKLLLFAKPSSMSAFDSWFPSGKTLQIWATDGDIRKVVKHHFMQLVPEYRTDAEFIEEVSEMVLGKSFGRSVSLSYGTTGVQVLTIHFSFSQASLHIGALEEYSFGKDHVIKLIDASPTSLNEIHTDAFEVINAQDGNVATMARLALMWVTYAETPLSMRELQHAISVSYDAHKFHATQSVLPPEDILRACCGLLILGSSSKSSDMMFVRLAGACVSSTPLNIILTSTARPLFRRLFATNVGVAIPR